MGDFLKKIFPFMGNETAKQQEKPMTGKSGVNVRQRGARNRGQTGAGGMLDKLDSSSSMSPQKAARYPVDDHQKQLLFESQIVENEPVPFYTPKIQKAFSSVMEEDVKDANTTDSDNNVVNAGRSLKYKLMMNRAVKKNNRDKDKRIYDDMMRKKEEDRIKKEEEDRKKKEEEERVREELRKEEEDRIKKEEDAIKRKEEEERVREELRKEEEDRIKREEDLLIEQQKRNEEEKERIKKAEDELRKKKEDEERANREQLEKIRNEEEVLTKREEEVRLIGEKEEMLRLIREKDMQVKEREEKIERMKKEIEEDQKRKNEEEKRRQREIDLRREKEDKKWREEMEKKFEERLASAKRAQEEKQKEMEEKLEKVRLEAEQVSKKARQKEEEVERQQAILEKQLLEIEKGKKENERRRNEELRNKKNQQLIEDLMNRSYGNQERETRLNRSVHPERSSLNVSNLGLKRQTANKDLSTGPPPPYLQKSFRGPTSHSSSRYSIDVEEDTESYSPSAVALHQTHKSQPGETLVSVLYLTPQPTISTFSLSQNNPISSLCIPNLAKGFLGTSSITGFLGPSSNSDSFYISTLKGLLIVNQLGEVKRFESTGHSQYFGETHSHYGPSLARLSDPPFITYWINSYESILSFDPRRGDQIEKKMRVRFKGLSRSAPSHPDIFTSLEPLNGALFVLVCCSRTSAKQLVRKDLRNDESPESCSVFGGRLGSLYRVRKGQSELSTLSRFGSTRGGVRDGFWETSGRHVPRG